MGAAPGARAAPRGALAVEAAPLPPPLAPPGLAPGAPRLGGDLVALGGFALLGAGAEPVLRSLLVRVAGEERRLLLLPVHHAALDGAPAARPHAR